MLTLSGSCRSKALAVVVCLGMAFAPLRAAADDVCRLLATARVRGRERNVHAARMPERHVHAKTEAEAEPELTRELVHERLRDIVAAIMGFRPDQMDPRRPLVELGLDSLMAVRIKNAAERDLRMPPLVPGMLRGASLADLADHLAGLLGLSGRHEPAQLVIGPRDTAERVLARVWEAELGRRQLLQFPPFVRLAALRLQGENALAGDDCRRRLCVGHCFKKLEDHLGSDRNSSAERPVSEGGRCGRRGTRLLGVDPPAAVAACGRTRLFTLAESLGGVESLIEHPASMTHAFVPAEQQEAEGILPGLVRFSVGCEDVDDLRADLNQALESVAHGSTAEAYDR